MFLITHLLRFSVRHPRTVIALVGVITVCALVFIPRIQLRLDGRSLIPSGLPEFAEGDQAAARFELRDLVLVGVGNESGVYTPETLRRIARLSAGLARVEGVVPGSVVSIATVPRIALVDGEVDTGPLYQPEDQLNKEIIQQLRRDVGRRAYDRGVLVSPDGKGAAIIAKVEPGADRYRLLEQTRSLIASESNGADAIYLSGSALAQAVLGRATARDLARLIPAVIAVLGVMLFLSFRHPVPALLSLTEIGVSLVWMSGLMGLTGQPVFVTTLVLPVVLICVGVSDDVYALGHFFNEAAHAKHSTVEDTIVAAFSSATRPVAATAVSTVVGLLSMAAVSLNPLRVFGLFGSAAIIFSTLFTFSLLPALLVLLKPQIRWKGEMAAVALGGRPATSALRLLTGRASPRRVAVCAVLIAACAILAITRLRVDDSWIRNLPTDSDIVQGDRFFNEKLAGTTALELMVDAKHGAWFNSREGMSALGSLEWVLARVPHVGAVNCLFNDMVRTNSSLVAGLNYGTYRAGLQSGRVPLRNKDVELALEVLSRSTLAPIRERVDSEHQRARLTIFIRDADYRRIDNVLQAAEREMSKQGLGHRIVPFGDGWISYLTVRLLVEGQAFSIVLALVTDLILITLLLGSLRMGFIAVLPVAFSLLVVLAALAVAGTPLGIANSMFAGIALGIGLDFAIHLTTAYRQRLRQGIPAGEALRSTLELTGPAICVSAASITAGFAVLMLSEIAPNLQLGVMVCLCLLTCAVTTLLLIPSLLRLWKVVR
ncbi:MAG TPA: MMPL family transporter [Pyrinomonadaceae bacterium]|nr:MMPL family transporter [Pyrinomonadaceae bacterium]